MTFTPTDTTDYTTATATVTHRRDAGDADDHLGEPGEHHLRHGADRDAARRDGERAGDLRLLAGGGHGAGRGDRHAVGDLHAHRHDRLHDRDRHDDHRRPVGARQRATFLKQDTTTEGNWIGTYGSQGYDIIGSSASLPSYATITPAGQSNYTWASSTTDPRGLQTAGGGSRIAACWYQSHQFLRHRQPHRRPGARPGAVLPRLGQPGPVRAGADHRARRRARCCRPSRSRRSTPGCTWITR